MSGEEFRKVKEGKEDQSGTGMSVSKIPSWEPIGGSKTGGGDGVISGVAQNVQLVVPDVLGSLFRSDMILFVLAMAEPQTFGRRELQTVPVRIVCYRRIPNFDGTKVTVMGYYDEIDSIFCGQKLDIDRLGISLRAAIHLRLRTALLHGAVLLCGLGALMGMVWLLSQLLLLMYSDLVAPLSPSGQSAETVGLVYVVVQATCSVIFLICFTVWAFVFKRIVINSLGEAWEKFIRRWTEY